MAQSFDEWANNPANRGKSVAEYLNQSTPTQTTTQPTQTTQTYTQPTQTYSQPTSTTYYSPANDPVAPFSNEQPTTNTVVSGAGTNKLSATQIQELDALANKSALTDIDRKNLEYAQNTYGYVLPSNRGNLETNIITDVNQPIDAETLKDVNLSDLAFNKKQQELEFQNQQWINEFLNQNQKQIDALQKQLEQMNNQMLAQAQSERDIAKDAYGNLASNSSNYRVQEVQKYYDKYNVSGTYNILSSVNSQIAELASSIGGTTATMDVASERARKMANLTALSNMAQGNLNAAIGIAGTYINASISGYEDGMRYYENLLNMADNNLITLSKQQISLANSRIEYYKDLVAQDQSKKDEVEKILTSITPDAMYRANNYGYDITDPTSVKNQQILNKAKAEQDFIDKLSVKYPTAGIVATDSMEQAYTKAQSTSEYVAEYLAGFGTDASVIAMTMELLKSGVTDDVNEALALANRISMEQSGKIETQPTPQTEASEQNKRIFNRMNEVFGFDENGNISITGEKAIRGISGNANSGNAWKAFWNKDVMVGDYAAVKVLLDEITSLSQLQSFEDAKAKGATFGAMSEAEWDILKKSANSLVPMLKFDENGDVKSFKDGISEEDAINAIKNFYMKVKENIDKYEKPRGNVDDVKVTEIPYTVKRKNGTTQTEFQCGEYINHKTGIKVGNTWDDKKDTVIASAKNGSGKIGTQGLQKGDVIFMNPYNSFYGHVAYVEDIDSDGNIIVSEANWVENNTNVGGKVRYGRKVDPNTVYGYVRPSEVK